MAPPPRYAGPTSHPEEIRSKVSKLVADWRVILSALGALVLVSFATHEAYSNLATKADLSREHDYAAGERATMRSAAALLSERVLRQETGNCWRDAALKAIADKLGVPIPPPANPCP